jgi:hypothetical protein
MLRVQLPDGRHVFIDDASWVSGGGGWPKVYTLELSIEVRRQGSIPSSLPGPLASSDVAEKAYETLLYLAAEHTSMIATPAATTALTAEEVAVALLAVILEMRGAV